MPRGGFGGGRGFGGGGRGFGGGGFGMRRVGYPLIGMGGGMGMGGGLLGTLMAGGLGYVLGSNNNNQQQPVVYQQAAPQPVVYQQPYPYQAPPAAPQGTQSADNSKLAQLQLLGNLRASGTLSEDEFEREKQKLLQS